MNMKLLLLYTKYLLKEYKKYCNEDGSIGIYLNEFIQTGKIIGILENYDYNEKRTILTIYKNQINLLIQNIHKPLLTYDTFLTTLKMDLI
jgi:hypothetical protein